MKPILKFKQYYPLSLRLWHWLNAFVILGLLATVLLRKTFLSWRTNSAFISQKLETIDVNITPEFAREIAVGIRNPMWDWHIYLGYALGGLLIIRILIALFAEKKCPLYSVIKNSLSLKQVSSNEKKEAFHFILVKAGYALFYLVTLFMVITGFLLTFKKELNLAKDFSGSIKDIHELTMWFFVAFVSLHLVGVIIYELTKGKGIVSDMINGGSKD